MILILCHILGFLCRWPTTYSTLYVCACIHMYVNIPCDSKRIAILVFEVCVCVFLYITHVLRP